ncbi:unnamed protein product, partial [Ectocarpus sp. 12 AP-2014]
LDTITSTSTCFLAVGRVAPGIPQKPFRCSHSTSSSSTSKLAYLTRLVSLPRGSGSKATYSSTTAGFLAQLGNGRCCHPAASCG